MIGVAVPKNVYNTRGIGTRSLLHDLLQVVINSEESSLSCVNLVKKRSRGHEDSSFTVSTSLKKEIGP